MFFLLYHIFFLVIRFAHLTLCTLYTCCMTIKFKYLSFTFWLKPIKTSTSNWQQWYHFLLALVRNFIFSKYYTFFSVTFTVFICAGTFKIRNKINSFLYLVTFFWIVHFAVKDQRPTADSVNLTWSWKLLTCRMRLVVVFGRRGILFEFWFPIGWCDLSLRLLSFKVVWVEKVMRMEGADVVELLSRLIELEKW